MWNSTWKAALAALLAAQSMGVLAQEVPKTITVALHPPEDGREVYQQSQAMLQRLSQKIGIEVKAFVTTDSTGVIEALRAKRADVGYMGPFAYILATSVADVEAFAIAEPKKTGKTAYHSLVITHKDSGYSSLSQLKGKSFAFTEPASASGFLVPKAGLLKEGIDADKFFGNVIFSGGHDNNGLAVANRKIDAAAIADTIYDSMIARKMIDKDKINVLWKSPPIPESPFVWRKDLPQELKAKIAAGLADMRDVSWSYHGPINGFKPTNDKEYDVLRQTAQQLKLDLKRFAK